MCPSCIIAPCVCVMCVCVCVHKLTEHACGIQMLPEDDVQINEYIHTFTYLQPL